MRSPHLFDKTIVELGITLVALLRSILASVDTYNSTSPQIPDETFSPWDLSDILEYSDLLLHASLYDKSWNKDILNLGISFSQKVLSSPSFPAKERLDAIKNVKDFFRVTWEVFQSSPKKAKRLVAVLKGGWWGYGKSIDDVARDVLENSANTSSSWWNWGTPKKSSVFMQEQSSSYPDLSATTKRSAYSGKKLPVMIDTTLSPPGIAKSKSLYSAQKKKFAELDQDRCLSRNNSFTISRASISFPTNSVTNPHYSFAPATSRPMVYLIPSLEKLCFEQSYSEHRLESYDADDLGDMELAISKLGSLREFQFWTKKDSDHGNYCVELDNSMLSGLVDKLESLLQFVIDVNEKTVQSVKQLIWRAKFAVFGARRCIVYG
ncbi:hypothetical protein HK098_000043 [Nowakowskiella sp. JEL0407]|nr:hypothetical protein HK098_000043 [Nowakowskiella sp. JEL0407]